LPLKMYFDALAVGTGCTAARSEPAPGSL
jgi:hypothetical protein